MSRSVGVLATVLLIGGFFFLISARTPAHENTDRMGRMLREYDIRERVVAMSGAYYVDRGTVVHEDGPHAASAHDEALRLAFALAAVRRSPTFAIPGEDIDYMRSAVGVLEDARRALQERSGTMRERTALSALFPVEFLRSLADTEEARRHFLDRADRASLRAYEISLLGTIRAYRLNLERFGTALEENVSPHVTYATSDALVSVAHVRDILRYLAESARLLEAEASRRMQCTRGIAPACDASDLAPPSIREGIRVVPSAADLARVADVLNLLDDAGVGHENTPLVAIRDASCTSASPGPELYSITRDTIGKEVIPAPIFVGDIRFLQTDNPDSEYLAFFKRMGVTHFWYSPFTHYKCLNVQGDMARIINTLETRAIALANPVSAYIREERSKGHLERLEALLASERFVEEADAREYISLSQRHVPHLPPHVADAVESLALRTALQTGALAHTARRIGTIELANLKRLDMGIPSDLSVPRLLLSDSGFFPLFLADNGSVAGSAPLIEPSSLPGLEEPFIYFSMLPEAPSVREEIVRDIRTVMGVYRDTDL
jgi:hypothetical protein